MGEESRYELEELIPIVAELAGKYNGYESTSLSYEKAQQLMEAVLYCIHECDRADSEEFAGQEECAGRERFAGLERVPGKEHPDGPQNQVRKEMSAEEAYRLGRGLLQEKVERTRRQYNRLAGAFCSYGNRCLKDTIRKGIPESYVRGVMAAHAPGAGSLIENICSVVWPNVLGHALLKKAFTDTGFSAEECGKLTEKLSGMGMEEVKELLHMMAEEILLPFFRDGEEMLRYFEKEISGVAVRCCHAISFGTVNRLFVW